MESSIVSGVGGYLFVVNIGMKDIVLFMMVIFMVKGCILLNSRYPEVVFFTEYKVGEDEIK